MSLQEELSKLTTVQLKSELSKYGKNTDAYNTPKQILVDFLVHIKEDENSGNCKKRPLDSDQDNNSPSKRHHVDGNNNNSNNINGNNNNNIEKRLNVILEDNDKAEDIELKLLSNFSYKPILEEFVKKESKYNGNLGYKLIKEYNRFMSLKIIEKDYNSTKLYPSPLIDEFWHCHILNTLKYDEFCQLVGKIIHHNPSIKDTRQTKYNRFLHTITLYGKFFGNNCEKIDDIWKFSFIEDDNEKQQQHNNNNKQHISIIIVNQYGEKEIYDITKLDCLNQLMQKYATNKGFNLEVLQYLYNGQIINENMTPFDLNMKNNDIIQVLPQKSRNPDKNSN